MIKLNCSGYLQLYVKLDYEIHMEHGKFKSGLDPLMKEHSIMHKTLECH